MYELNLLCVANYLTYLHNKMKIQSVLLNLKISILSAIREKTVKKRCPFLKRVNEEMGFPFDKLVLIQCSFSPFSLTLSWFKVINYHQGLQLDYVILIWMFLFIEMTIRHLNCFVHQLILRVDKCKYLFLRIPSLFEILSWCIFQHFFNQILWKADI